MSGAGGTVRVAGQVYRWREGRRWWRTQRDRVRPRAWEGWWLWCLGSSWVGWCRCRVGGRVGAHGGTRGAVAGGAAARRVGAHGGTGGAVAGGVGARRVGAGSSVGVSLGGVSRGALVGCSVRGCCFECGGGCGRHGDGGAAGEFGLWWGGRRWGDTPERVAAVWAKRWGDMCGDVAGRTGGVMGWGEDERGQWEICVQMCLDRL